METFNNSASSQPIQMGKEEFTEFAFKRQFRQGNEILLTLKNAEIGKTTLNLFTVTLEKKSNLRTLNNKFYATLDFEYNEYGYLEPHGKVFYLHDIKLIRIEISFSKEDILLAFVLPYAQK